LEIKLTGILQTYVMRENEPNPYGTTVAPRVNAQYHQHIFSLRVDPMVDGLANSVLETDVVPFPAPVGSQENFAGNAFTTKKQILQVEGSRDYDWASDRRWKIINPSSKHYASGDYTGYGIHLKGGIVPLLAKEGSWVAQRARFASKPMWVVKDKEGEKGTERMWPAGKYVPQSRGEVDDSIGKWAEGKASVDNEDIVLFLTIGERRRHIPYSRIRIDFLMRRGDAYPPPRGLSCVRLTRIRCLRSALMHSSGCRSRT
jgi:primary-amine oxidase